ncbi:MAG: hypothetical protein KIT83_22350, partial [Bryobacterales bacterium]|nr:hypothetical protein [Bryobacterales bacterium]
WTVRKQADTVTLSRQDPAHSGIPDVPTLVVSAAAIFLCVTGFRILTSSEPAGAVLLSYRTPLVLFLILVFLVPLIRISKRWNHGHKVILGPGRAVTETFRFGEMQSKVVEKNRILRLIHSRPRNPDGSRYDGGSVELEYRGDGGGTEQMTVMYGQEQEILWFVPLLEAWSGLRARTEDFEIDSDEDEDGELEAVDEDPEDRQEWN